MGKDKFPPLKKMTIKKALSDCYKMWTWLADNPGKDKEECHLFRDKAYNNECPCCEYVVRKHNNLRAAVGFVDEDDKNNGCRDCPLIDLWPEGCCADGSPYEDWCDAMDNILSFEDGDPETKRNARKAAKRIAKAAKNLSEASGWHLG